MKSYSKQFVQNPKKSSKRGAVIIEFALVCPIIVLIVFGTIDICSFYYLKQTLKIASYEATRIAVIAGSTTSLVETQAKMLLDNSKVNGYLVTVTPSPESLNRGDFVTVSVTAPSGPNLPLKGWFCSSKSTFAQTSMMSDR